jgi:hypothetical protein
MIPIKPELLREILLLTQPRALTLKDIEDGIRNVITNPEKAEKAIGHMYGCVFRKREILHDQYPSDYMRKPLDETY